jgi:cysteine-rich repeat protein
MISNLRFNINLTNYGYCGVSVENPGATTTCQNDLDCSSGEFCSAQIDKLKRNYDRLRDLQEVQSTIEGSNLSLNGWWHSDETVAKINTDNVVIDSSGKNSNGKIIGSGVTVGQTGITGKAYSFKYIGASSPNYIQLPADKMSKKVLTVEFWVKFSDLKCNRQPFTIMTANSKEFLSFSTQPTASSACLSSTQCQNNTSDCFSGLTMNVLDKGKCAVSQMFSTSTWYHITGVVDTVNGFMRVYKNGAKICESAISKGDISTSPSKILVGSTIGGQNQHIGQLDEIKIFNRVLTGSEIYSQMNGVNTEAGKKLTFPDIKSGSYLTGQSLSVWSSWTTLANTLGKSLPYDPINELGIAGTCKTNPALFCVNDYQCPTSTCVLHDSTTGWSTEDRRFSFACASSSYAYRYLYSTSTGYMVRAHFENPFGQYINNISTHVNEWNSFVGDFIDLNRFVVSDASGICMQDQEISTINQGRCGDSVLNIDKGEECDPPGKTVYDKSNCVVITNSAVLNTCDSKCKWSQTTLPCSTFSKCGNGILELGEKCDDGNLNGSYNKCNKICTGKVAPYGSKDYDEKGNLAFESFGYCGDGAITPKLKNVFYELCDYSISGFSLYSKKKEKSCSYDCQNFGQYCGDGIVQNSSTYPNLANANEECEGTTTKTCTTTVSGVIKQGTQNCDFTNCVFQFCTTTAQSVSVSGSYCGDGMIDSGEECDTGTANLNKVCIVKYGVGCSYCTDKCTVKIVDPLGYCGDGVVQKENESCDWDKTSKTIYSSVSSTGTFLSFDQTHKGFQVLQCAEEAWVGGQSKAGIKTCDSKCELKDNCVKCGIDEDNGVKVAGEIINVLDPKSNNPLFSGISEDSNDFLRKLYNINSLYSSNESCCGQGAQIDLNIVQSSNSYKYVAGAKWSIGNSSTNTRQYYLSKTTDYLLGQLYDSTAGCAVYVPPLPLSYKKCIYDSVLLNVSSTLVAASSDCSYKVVFNNDSNRSFDISVVAEKIAKPWQYDFVLSPIMLKNSTASLGLGRPNDVRVVVTYTGLVPFYGGFQFYYDPTGGLLSSNLIKLEGLSFTKATGTNYYQGPSSSAIWYHGLGSTKNQTSAEAFTIDNYSYTIEISVPKLPAGTEYKKIPIYGKRIFYVRAANVYDGIYKYKNTANLKVDVYFPKEDDKYFFRHFDNKPDKTFYLKDAIDSDNKTAASYWQVLNLSPGSNTIEEINAIKTDPKYFEYSASQ